jgi:hypothetical protein
MESKSIQPRLGLPPSYDEWSEENKTWILPALKQKVKLLKFVFHYWFGKEIGNVEVCGYFYHMETAARNFVLEMMKF